MLRCSRGRPAEMHGRRGRSFRRLRRARGASSRRRRGSRRSRCTSTEGVDGAQRRRGQAIETGGPGTTACTMPMPIMIVASTTRRRRCPKGGDADAEGAMEVVNGSYFVTGRRFFPPLPPLRSANGPGFAVGVPMPRSSRSRARRWAMNAEARRCSRGGPGRRASPCRPMRALDCQIERHLALAERRPGELRRPGRGLPPDAEELRAERPRCRWGQLMFSTTAEDRGYWTFLRDASKTDQ